MPAERSTLNSPRLPGSLVDRLSRWPLTAAVAAAIFALSELPQSALPPTNLFPLMDKVAHLTEYLTLGAALFRSVQHHLYAAPRLSAIIAIACGTAYGILDEWHQSFTGRTPDAMDALADSVGIVCGVLLIVSMRTWRRKHGG